MNLLDFPLLAKANSALRFQNMFPKEAILERKLFHSHSLHDFAANYLALWLYQGRKPSARPLNEFQRKAMDIACKVWDEVSKVKVEPAVKYRKELLEFIACQQRLTTSAYSGVKGSSFLETGPSEEARRQAVEYREKHGSRGHIVRVVKKREKCHTFDAKYPTHW